MAINVNPPPQLRIPKQFLDDPEAREYFKQANTILFQLWQRTGGNNDSISNSEQALTSTGSRVSRNAARIYSLESAGDEPDVNNQKINKNSARINNLESLIHEEKELTAATGTTSGNQIWTCNNAVAAVLTLNTAPADGEDVHITRKDAPLTVSGAISGSTSINFLMKGDSAHLRYSEFNSEWAIL